MTNTLARNGEGGDVNDQEGAILSVFRDSKGKSENIVRFCV